MTPLVSVRHVSKRLGAHVAVDRVSLDVMDREALAVFGPSGSGKTTLLRLIAGLETPDIGEIWLNGLKVSGARQSLIPPHMRRIGFVFQDLALWPHLSVEKQLEFVLASTDSTRSERASRIREVLALVRIDQLAGRYPHQLSGGEQQRVALARAVIARPRLLLLDEPLSSLDLELRTQLRHELSRLKTSMGLAMVCVTHEPEDASVLANRVVHIRDGRLV